jgi:hypothetical protein
VTTIDPQRLAEAMTWTLDSGQHDDVSKGACVMEAVAYVAGEWTDHPGCACPVIGAFLRAWNDGLPDADRTRLLRDLIPRLVGTRSTPDVELRRSRMALDWYVREQTPAWLDMAPSCTEHAAALRALQELVDGTTVETALVVLDRARVVAAAARAAAWAAARAAARDAAWAAARDAARAAAWAAARDSAWAAARDAAWAAAMDSAWAAARDAAWAAAMDAAWDSARATVERLQLSALGLVDRMIAVQP